MKKTILTVGLVFLGLFGATSSYAACDAHGCTSKIKNLYISGTSDARIFIFPDDSTTSELNCTLAEGIYLTLKKDHLLHSEIYSALLAAKFSDRSIRMRIVDGSNDCELIYVMIQ